MPESLEAASVLFATEVQATLDGVLPGDRIIISRRAERDDRYVVRPEGKNVPLLVGGDHLADLAPAVYLGLDRTGEFLKAVRSEFVVKSVLDRTPLVRLDYRTDMNRAPRSPTGRSMRNEGLSPTSFRERTRSTSPGSGSPMTSRPCTSRSAGNVFVRASRTSCTSWWSSVGSTPCPDGKHS